MGIGLGVLLIVIGAVLEWAVVLPEATRAYINQWMLGWILMGAGVAVIILSLIVGAMRGRTTTIQRREYDDGRSETDRYQTRGNSTEL